MPISNETRIQIVFDHVLYLTDQVRRLGAMLEANGIEVPDDLGTLGTCPQEACERLIDESMKRYNLDTARDEQ